MDERKALDILSGRDRGLAARALRAGLSVAAGPYACAMRIRRWLYRRGVLAGRDASVPVICVGNVTTGGTGKTPMVAWIIRLLADAGHRPAVLTRGYRAVEGFSDEAELLRRTGAEVVVNADRIAGAVEAVRRGADVVVMDDGYQHLRLRRDLDVLLVDATEPFGFGWCLPRGLLREPLSALADAGAIVITRSDRVSPRDLRGLRGRLVRLAPGAGIFSAVHRPTGFVDQQGETRTLDGLVGQKAFAFCGIANPVGFFDTLKELGVNVVARRALADHAHYDAELVRTIHEQAVRAGASVLVTTTKDGVKLAEVESAMSLWQLEVEIEITEGAEELTRRILDVAGGDRARSRI